MVLGKVMKVTNSFFHGKVKYVNSKTPINQKYVDTIQNPADIGNRESNVNSLPKEWRDGEMVAGDQTVLNPGLSNVKLHQQNNL